VFNSVILDVAIGLAFVYAVLGLMCTAVNEIIEGLLKKRAVHLERGIREMLADRKGTGLTQALYDHPLISSLFNGDYHPTDTPKRKLPSYIPSRNFALALLDIALPASAANASGAAGATSLRRTPSQISISAPPTVTAVNVEVQPGGANPPSAAPLKGAIDTLANEKVERALRTLVDAAGNDMAKARESIEQWYDSAMDRVSGQFKRYVQWVTLIMAILVVAALNADTIAISKSLTEDVNLRNAVVAAAQERVKANASSEARGDKGEKGANIKGDRGAADKGEKAAGGKGEKGVGDKDEKAGVSKDNKADSGKGKEDLAACKRDPRSAECTLEKNAAGLRSLGLPLGWNTDERTAVPGLDDSGAWALKLLGLLLTAIAVSLGAPFWFDVLNKIMVVRATVKPREKSPEEPPVDR
jgi:hypothetical protein